MPNKYKCSLVNELYHRFGRVVLCLLNATVVRIRHSLVVFSAHYLIRFSS
ncbi:Uncharacterised protein [Vibrio furnissii]|nr:Uncharacterised protein [Vibrio furnissii]